MLHQAYLDAARSKLTRRACHEFGRRLGSNIEALYRELQSGEYRPRPYHTFMVHEPKPRLIYAPAFRDCVVQHAIYRVVRTLFDRTFIDQSYACRPGKGTHMAADYAQEALRAIPGDSYVLKLDIRRFFYRIDRQVLRQLIERKIKDRRFVDIMMLFADHGEPLGIPIGNLLSQLYALIYLNPLDHYIKRELKVERYCRYVDDFVLFGLDRTEALEHKRRIVQFLDERLRLELSRATLAKARRGINFVGYRTWSSKRFIRRRSLYNFRRAIKRGRLDSAISIIGHARRTHSMQHLLKTLRERNSDLYRSLPERIIRIHVPPMPADHPW
jgi:hypothetical protein